jgi:hypothetical protein
LNFERIWLCLILALAGAPGALLGATNNPLQIAVRYHCAGGERLAANTNLATLNRIGKLPSTVAFRNLAIDKVSALLTAGLGFDSKAAEKSLLSPLLADLLEKESLGAFGGTSSNVLDFVVALRVEAKRAQFWHEKLAQALGGPGEKFTAEGCSGWRWNRAGSAAAPAALSGAAPASGAARSVVPSGQQVVPTGASGGVSATNSDSFWIIPARDWLVVGRGDDLLRLQVEYLQEISRQDRPGSSLDGNLMEAEVDLSQLAPWLPEEARFFRPARIKLTVGAKADHVNITAHAVYPESIPWRSQPWEIPTELVRSPLISFTAGQDLAAYLNLGAAFTQVVNDPLTNQFCAWALGDLVFQTYMEWPVSNASNALQTLSAQAPRAFNPGLKGINRGEIVWMPERGRLVLGKLGIVAPSVEVAPAKEGQFLLLSLFPLSVANKPAPEELWAQIKGRSDLVCYDWEATGPRLQQWRLLSQILLHLPEASVDEPIETTVIKENWLNGIGSPKGNAVTEITREAPNELSLVRNAPLGFTGLELILLSDWISRSRAGLGNPERSPASRSPLPQHP